MRTLLLILPLTLLLALACQQKKQDETGTCCTTQSQSEHKSHKCSESKSCSKGESCCKNKKQACGSNSCSKNNKTVVMKKYDNDYFYENGKLSVEKALNAYKELLEQYGQVWTPYLEKNLWITDFGLGDFAHVGMAGVFWINDETHEYFAHEIYLLPGQMIVEHKHVKTKFPAKMETWHVRNGKVYTFGEGEKTTNNPELPESQANYITVHHATPVHAGELSTLNRLEAPHFMIADHTSGAIVSEYANYHDGNGLVFTNPKVVFTDIRTKP